MNPPMRFVILLVMTGISLILGSLLTFSLTASYLHIHFAEIQQALLDPKNARVALLANAFASLISFLLPSVAIAFFTKGSILRNMGFKTFHAIQLIYWVILLSFVGLLLSGSAASFTEKIPVPHAFKIWANGLEETYKQAMLAMTKMESLGDLFFSLFAVAIIPAVVEELFFRGALQNTIKGWSRKPLLAIFLTAVIFSAFHFSYYGFLSRMLLGMLLGFIFEYTGSIWLSILMHFINNAVAVVALYSVRGSRVQVEKAMNETVTMYWGILAIVLAVFLLHKIKQDAHYERLDKNIL